MADSTDLYYTTADSSTGDYREKGSKFLSYQYHVTSIEQVEARLEEVHALHPKGRHHCYAYRLGITGKSFEVEPSIVIRIRNSQLEEKLILLKAQLLGISTEQITDETTVPFCKIENICSE